jgi:transglutaminase-like putative cysteine protease
MRVHVEHHTTYHYETPLRYAIQRIYLTPRDDPGQRVVRWEVTGSGDFRHQRDAFGNWMSTLVITRPTQALSIRVFGEVECEPRPMDRAAWAAFASNQPEPPVEFYLRDTALTRADEALAEFAAALPPCRAIDDLIGLAALIEERLTYTPGVTDVATTAAHAWAHGAGVCQDHTHVMIALCRAQGLPARYVSGYLTGEARAGAATHAWVDVWLDGLWVPIDVTHQCLATERWLRLAVGADYEAVSPVRGVRQGGGEESMQVQVSVRH